MVPGEHTVGQTQLMVQLAVGDPKNWTVLQTGRGLFIGTHDVITAWGNDAFYVTAPATSLRALETMLQAPGAQTAYTKGRRDGCQVWPDFVTKAKCNKVSRKHKGIPKHTVTLSPRLMPNALVGTLLQEKLHE